MWPFDEGARYTLEGPWTWDKPGYEEALANFRAVHGHDPHPLTNANALYYTYKTLRGAHIILAAPLEHLPVIAADLSQRIEAAKHKHGIA